MTRRLLLTFTIAAATAAVPVAAADAAKPAPYPSVTKIEPMNVGVGDLMTISGRNFIAGPRRNTVVFKRDGKRAIFVKAEQATKTKLTLTLPATLRSVLGRRDGQAVASKFRIRVLSRRFAKGFTSLAKSPTVAPQSLAVTVAPAPAPAPKAGESAPVESATTTQAAAATGAGTSTTPAAAPAPTPAPVVKADCDDDGTPNASDADDDNDQLPDGTEQQLGTDSCKADTDDDSMQDGWEYRSAVDLNRESCPAAEYPTPCAAVRPYPGKSPFPNPLNADDQVDFDGDNLDAGLEHRAWLRHSPRSIATGMWYSDGLQSSIDSRSGDGCRGMTVPPVPAYLQTNPAYGVASDPQAYSLDEDRNGCLSDDERDEDGDALGNFFELTGPMSAASWWSKLYKTEPLYPVAYKGLNWLDGDSDGDDVPDAIDDQDFDDFWNIEEIERGPESAKWFTFPNGDGELRATGVMSGLWVGAFNPCLPSPAARTCNRRLPLDGTYWAPFWHDEDPTAKYPYKLVWPLWGEVQGSPYNGPLPAPHPIPIPE